MGNQLEENNVAQCWDGNADIWTDQVRKGYDMYREVLNNPYFYPFIGPVKGKIILDAGCGEGTPSRKLAKMGAIVYGIDISPKMIEYAKKSETENPLGIHYYLGSFSKLDIFENEKFDLVVSFMALMDSPHYEKSIEEIYRVLKQKGELIFSITHPCFITPGLGWVTDKKGERIKLTISNYFIEDHYVEQWKFSKSPEAEKLPMFNIPRFPRTLSGYVNSLIEVGFKIKRIQEPKPTKEICKEHPWLTQWYNTATPFLYIKVEKT